MQEKREYVMNMYPGDRWRQRVRGMSDEQIFAIYMDAVNRLVKDEPKQDEPKHTQESLF